jgi:hypothetical protein
MKKSNNTGKEILYSGLFIIIGYLLYVNFSAIYGFADPEIDFKENYFFESKVIFETSTIISRQEIVDLAIRIINVNILILCMVLLLNDLISLIKADGGLRKQFKNV